MLYANTEGLGVEQLEAFDLASIGDEAGPPRRLDRLGPMPALPATVASVREQMDGFDCTSAGREIAAFVDELSNWYVRLGRRRFWDGDLAALPDPAPLPAGGDQAAGAVHRSSPTRSTPTSPGARTVARRPSDSRVPPRRLPQARQERSSTRSSRPAWRRCAAPSSSAAPRIPSKVKVRQPLRKAVIVASSEERPEIERLSELVASRRTDVKELEFVAEESDLVAYRVKPNFRALGPRFGKDMPQAKAAIESLDLADVSRRRSMPARRSASPWTARTTPSAPTTSAS